MDGEICKRFKNVWEDFPDTLSSGNYQFKSDKHSQTYCTNINCDNNVGKIHAVCLFLFNALLGSSSFKINENSKIIIVEYIMIWLSYMLSRIENEGNSSTLQFFFSVYINGGDYYSSYKDLINKNNYFLKMDNNIISKFYGAFKSLCNLYTQFDEDTDNCKNYLEGDNEFIKKYEELKKDSKITKDNSYSQLLSTLLNDYNNLKDKCNDASSFTSIANKLFIVLSIFAAIAIFLGISYKYSLFGFRKRFQKQKLREKIKNIKKRMNH
ncbi:PIR protein [Plasmodium yoelii]|uniref:PIR protein n=2 Tax=Plasmodium yoelii TaxID=5861 RepID=A0AAE9WT70_PLAYO|nr:PIR protein [Plasmodium yoelii]WBY59560.1 PIR protein [Plasmodium yoelii yoelii]VTZ80302.1 PIR protein [Plasmodium yoelii]|eukprot:XP_034493576.1 PIR protein [Plasmodium yoelii]